MKSMWPAVLLSLGGIVVVGFAVLVFLNLGGFELVRSNAAVANRGFVATEPDSAPGFRRLLLPRGWERDTLSEYSEDNLAGRPQSAGPRTAIHMGGPDDALLHFVLGQYSHTAGTVSPASATLYARPSDSPRWTAVDGANGLGRETARVELLKRDGPVEVYVGAGDAGQEFPWVLLHDPAKGLRLELAAGGEIYDRAQLIRLGASMLAEAERDEPALMRARAEWRTRNAAVRAASSASLAWVQRQFGLAKPLQPGLTMLGPQSPAWLSGDTLHAFIRIGTAPAAPGQSEARAAAMQVDEARMTALVAQHPGGTPAELRPNDLLAAWADGDAIRLWSMGDGAMGIKLTPSHPLHAPLKAALPEGTIGFYRESNLYLPEQARIAPWFALSAAYARAQAETPPLIR